MGDAGVTAGTQDAAGSAGWHLAREVPAFPPDSTAGAARAALAGRRFDCVDLILVTDPDRRLLGVVPIRQVLALDAGATLQAEMLREFPAARAESDQEHVASLALEHGLTAIPVVDAADRLVGVVPRRRCSTSCVGARRGLAPAGGNCGRERARARRHRSAPGPADATRLPWLLVGLAGSIVATAVMAHFEGVLAANVAVAFFVPGIVYLADAIGTQTETIAVRGLSLSRVRIGHLLANEIRTGLLIGAVLVRPRSPASGSRWATCGSRPRWGSPYSPPAGWRRASA